MYYSGHDLLKNTLAISIHVVRKESNWIVYVFVETCILSKDKFVCTFVHDKHPFILQSAFETGSTETS